MGIICDVLCFLIRYLNLRNNNNNNNLYLQKKVINKTFMLNNSTFELGFMCRGLNLVVKWLTVCNLVTWHVTSVPMGLKPVADNLNDSVRASLNNNLDS